MNTITYRFFSDINSVYKFSPIFTTINIETVLPDNFSNISSTNTSHGLCEYFKKHYRNITFSQSQEVHMRYVTIIRNLREDADKTQQEIADFLGTSQTMYARYERGANEMPIRHLMKLAQYYNVSLDYLCGLTTFKRPYPML